MGKNREITWFNVALADTTNSQLSKIQSPDIDVVITSAGIPLLNYLSHQAQLLARLRPKCKEIFDDIARLATNQKKDSPR